MEEVSTVMYRPRIISPLSIATTASKAISVGILCLIATACTDGPDNSNPGMTVITQVPSGNEIVGKPAGGNFRYAPTTSIAETTSDRWQTY